MLNILKTTSTSTEIGQDTESEVGMPACRICYESSGNPIEPCNCRGTIGKVHLDCLEKWLTDNSSTKCELCLFQYKVEQVPKYNLAQSLAVWTHKQFTTQDSFDIILMAAWVFIVIGAAIFVLPQLKHAVGWTSQILFFMCIIDGSLVIARFIYLLWQSYRNWLLWWDSQTKVSLKLEEMTEIAL